MNRRARSKFAAAGCGLFIGVLVGAVLAGPPFGAFTYVLAGVGAALWLVMTYLADRQQREVTS